MLEDCSTIVEMVGWIADTTSTCSQYEAKNEQEVGGVTLTNHNSFTM